MQMLVTRLLSTEGKGLGLPEPPVNFIRNSIASLAVAEKTPVAE